MPGLLVLDAHRTPFDIFRTAIWLRKTYDPEMIHLPLAAYFCHAPIIKTLVKYCSSKYKIKMHPVYRMSDLTSNNPMTRFLCSFYPKSLTLVERHTQNKKYLDAAMKAIKSKHEIVIVSPYGGYSFYGGKIKYGVRMLISQHPRIMATRTKFATKFVDLDLTHTPVNQLNQTLQQVFASLG